MQLVESLRQIRADLLKEAEKMRREKKNKKQNRKPKKKKVAFNNKIEMLRKTDPKKAAALEKFGTDISKFL